MRIANWNIEWMNNWFVGGDDVDFRDSYHPQGKPGDAIDDVDALCTRVASIVTLLDPDALCIQEGPSDIREMELFVSSYLKDDNGDPLYRAFGGLYPREERRCALKPGGI